MVRILLAEDDRNIYRLVDFGLQRLGYEVIWAQHGGEAVMLARQHLPDLLLLDVMMPVLNGFQVVETLQQHVETQGIPIIMLTAHGQDQVPPTLAHKDAVYDYVRKPFGFTDLVARIQAVLAQTGRGQEADRSG